MTFGEIEPWTISILLIRHDWRTCIGYISAFLGLVQFLPWWCLTNFLKCTLMFDKGQEALCVWIQLGKGVLEREDMKPEKMQAGPYWSFQSTGRLLLQLWLTGIPLEGLELNNYRTQQVLKQPSSFSSPWIRVKVAEWFQVCWLRKGESDESPILLVDWLHHSGPVWGSAV